MEVSQLHALKPGDVIYARAMPFDRHPDYPEEYLEATAWIVRTPRITPQTTIVTLSRKGSRAYVQRPSRTHMLYHYFLTEREAFEAYGRKMEAEYKAAVEAAAQWEQRIVRERALVQRALQACKEKP